MTDTQPTLKTIVDARLTKLRDTLNRENLDAILVTSMPNVFYLTGFTGSTAALVVTGTNSHILVDPRYTVQARDECASAQVHEFTNKAALQAVAELLNELDIPAVGYEASDLTVLSHRKLRSLTNSAIRLRSTSGIIEKLRQIKDAHEISLIRTAASIADSAFESVVLELRPGMTEKDAALLIDSTLRKMGADKEAFDTIAASGSNAACPHASPTDTVLQRKNLLKMDFGALYRGYNSDITRTVCLGTPTRRQKDVYQIVLDAQLAAIDAVAPGKRGKEIDAAAREYIASKGYGDNFGHGLGHMVGIEVHDGEAFSTRTEVVLEPGMVATVEPGIYIEGWGGIRIEDDILVTEAGCEVITAASKEFTSI